MTEPETISREQFLSMTADVYLRDGFVAAEGGIRPELLGEYATAAVEQFLAGQLHLDELEATYQALIQTLPLYDSELPERFISAFTEAQEIVSQMLGGQENNAVFSKWFHTCAPAVKTSVDLEFFMAHFLAVLRQFAVVSSIRNRQ